MLSNGPPVPNCQVRVLRDSRFVGEREIGEICVLAPFLFDGYYQSGEAARGAFHGKWFRTGDLGFLDAGEVFVVGRIKDIIIVHGRNVFAHDIEAAVSVVPGVKDGRVVAFGHYIRTIGSEQLVVIAEQGRNDVSVAQITRDINQAVINEVGIPAGDVRIVDQGWLVKTTSGKISRVENVRKYNAWIC